MLKSPIWQNPDWMRRLQAPLIAWFEGARREMPWRGPPDVPRDPYQVWISEVMLQQTQVTTVIPYFLRFLARFPTVEALATAPQEEVLSLWRGLGYYARARNLQRGAQYVLEHHGGNFPAELTQALKVPGVGRYTAGAILSLAYGQPVALLDGNVARVLARVCGLAVDPKLPAGQKAFWAIAEALVPAHRPGAYNEALMELGATVCTPTRPLCSSCPIVSLCHAATLPDPTAFPIKSESKARPDAQALAVVLRRPTDNAVLFALRPQEGLLGGMWELPTVVIEAEEPFHTTLSRLAERRLGLTFPLSGGDGGSSPSLLVPEGLPVEVEHIFTHLRLVLQAVECRVEPEMVQLEQSAAQAAAMQAPVRRRGAAAVEVRYEGFRWVEPEALSSLPMGRATLKALELLHKRTLPRAQLGLFSR